jgi:hypothetical protein
LAAEWTRRLLNRYLGARFRFLGEVLYAIVNYFPDRFEKLDPRVRQVLPHLWRNAQSGAHLIEKFPA